jgi:hypothetical protein
MAASAESLPLTITMKEKKMDYLVDILGQNNLHINSDRIPRIGELVQFIPETFEGQEGKLEYRVKSVVYTLGKGFESDVPTVILVSEIRLDSKQ